MNTLDVNAVVTTINPHFPYRYLCKNSGHILTPGQNIKWRIVHDAAKAACRATKKI